MKVLLLQDIDKVGKQGDTIDVKDGFARNYLFPRLLAIKPTGKADKQLELVKRRQKKIEQKLITEAQQVLKVIEQIPEISIEVRANEQGHLYGSVTPSMIVDALKEHKVKIDSKQVQMPDAIKQTGEFPVVIAVYKNLTAKLKMKVVASAQVQIPEPQKAEEKKKGPEATPTAQ